MDKINYYKQAPTVLYHLDKEPKTFHTQEEVDEAWEEGWFGPPGLASSASVISGMEWMTKGDMIDAVHDDPRYEGLILNKRDNIATIVGKIKAFEEENDVGSAVVIPEEE